MGRKKVIASETELVDLFREFCDEITDGGFIDIPSKTDFAAWLMRKQGRKTLDRRTVYNAIYKYFPASKDKITGMVADVIAKGTMLGKYQPSMAIFTLKTLAAGQTSRR